MEASMRNTNNIITITGTGTYHEQIGADLGVLRRHNRRAILNYLRENGPTPRATIAQKLKMSRSTVSSIIEELKADNFVSEGTKQQATERGGRRATRVYFNAKCGYIIGIDIGRSHLNIYITDLAAQIIGQEASGFDPIRHDVVKSVAMIAEKVLHLIEMNGIEMEKIRGIGVSVPGVIDQNTGKLISPPILTNWFNGDVRGLLARKLKMKNMPILVGNDADMGALGESRIGKGRGIANLVYIKIGTGIGAGIIQNGELLLGNGGLAAEIGHVLVGDNNGERCGSCGNYGCLEAIAGEQAIIEAARNSSAQLYHTNHTEYKKASQTKHELKDVIEAANNNDIACRDVLRRTGETIGKVLGSFVMNWQNPSHILLDGGTIRTCEEYKDTTLIDSIRRAAIASALPAAKASIEIGQLGNKAVGLGAIALVLEHDPDLAPPNRNSQL